MSDLFNEIHIFACYDELVEINESKYLQEWNEHDELVELCNETI